MILGFSDLPLGFEICRCLSFIDAMCTSGTLQRSNKRKAVRRLIKLRDVFHMDPWLYVFMICCCVKVSRVQNTDTECRSINQRSEFDILMAKVVAGVNRSSVFSIDL